MQSIRLLFPLLLSSVLLLPPTLLGLATIASNGTAQTNRNVQRLGGAAPRGTTTNPEVRLYSDVWGYAAPDGREYALLCADVGTYVFDCTNPARPVQRGFISGQSSGWRNSTWRDVKTYRTYAYVVTEGGGGMQIIDLTNAAQPKLLKTWGAQVWANAHNIAIDPKTGVAYICGARNGTHVIDLKTDPVNPRYLGTQALPYIHDLHVQNGYGHLAELNGNNYVIIDVTSVPTLRPVSGVRAPGTRWVHSAWATEDDDYCLTTNEVSGGPVGIFDIRNKSVPTLVATYTAGPSVAIPHAPFARDRVAHIAYYTEGYRAVDLSDPTSPVEVGFYDTFPGPSGGIAGAWGCYCFLPSGAIYISDVQSGLYILQSEAAALRYGSGTPGTGNTVPVIRPFGSAYLGNRRYKIEVTGAPPNARAYCGIGTQRGNLNIGGLVILLNPLTTAVIPTQTNAAGKASMPLSVPNVSALAGVTLYAQYLIEHPNGPRGFSASRGLAFRLFNK